MHSIAAMVERLRAGAGTVGYVSGLGMSAAKHTANVFSTDPARIAAADGETPRVQLPAEEFSGPEIADAPQGPGSIETYTVAFDRENDPQTSQLIVRLDDGRRTVAHAECQPAGDGDSPFRIAAALVDLRPALEGGIPRFPDQPPLRPAGVRLSWQKQDGEMVPWPNAPLVFSAGEGVLATFWRSMAQRQLPPASAIERPSR